MGYPHGKTYLQQIQEDKNEKLAVRNAFWALRKKFINDRPDMDDISLDIDQEFALLGEAFDLVSRVGDVPDPYHFMWDVLDALLPEESDDNNNMEKEGRVMIRTLKFRVYDKDTCHYLYGDEIEAAGIKLAQESDGKEAVFKPLCPGRY